MVCKNFNCLRVVDRVVFLTDVEEHDFFVLHADGWVVDATDVGEGRIGEETSSSEEAERNVVRVFTLVVLEEEVDEMRRWRVVRSNEAFRVALHKANGSSGRAAFAAVRFADCVARVDDSAQVARRHFRLRQKNKNQ